MKSAANPNEWRQEPNSTYDPGKVRWFAFAQEGSAWSCWLTESTVWTPPKGEEPNTFHRFMQRLCFGVKWRRTK